MKTAAVQRLKAQTVEHTAPSANSFTCGDLPLSELSEETKTRIADFRFPSWLGSLGFCESYAYPPVQNVAFCANPSGEIQEAIFYNERKWAGRFKESEIVGSVYPESELLLKLSTEHRPDLIRLSLQSASKFPDKIDGWMLAGVRRVNEDSIGLSPTREEYLQQLGKQTRKHLPYYFRRLKRECQEGLVIQTAIDKQISKQSFIDLLELNQLRMRSKGRETLWTRDSARHRWPHNQKTGLFFGLLLGGELAGGTLSFLYGGEAFLITIAHDPQYDRWNLGNICLWQTVEHLIRLRCCAFHLLWGTSFYKAQFDGQLAPLYRATYARNISVAAACQLSRLLRTEEAVSLLHRISHRLRGYGFLFESACRRNAGQLMGSLTATRCIKRRGMYSGFPKDLIAIVRCPRDGGALHLGPQSRGDRVLNAEVTCAASGFSNEIRNGILRLLPRRQPLDSAVRDEQEARDQGADSYEAHFSKWESDTEFDALLSDPALIREKGILDLACGTGRFTRSLAALASATITADLSKESPRVFSFKIPQEVEIGLIWGDAVQLRFAPSSFDVILSTQLLEHIPSREKRMSLLRSAHLHLKPSFFLLTVYYYSLLRGVLHRNQEGFHESGVFYHRFTTSEICNELGAGFRVVETRPLLPDRRVLAWLSALGAWTRGGIQSSILAHLVGQLLFIRAQRADITMEGARVA